MTVDIDDIARRADGRHAVHNVLVEARRQPRPFGVTAIVGFLDDPSHADAGFLRLLADPTSTGSFVL